MRNVIYFFCFSGLDLKIRNLFIALPKKAQDPVRSHGPHVWNLLTRDYIKRLGQTYVSLPQIQMYKLRLTS